MDFHERWKQSLCYTVLIDRQRKSRVGQLGKQAESDSSWELEDENEAGAATVAVKVKLQSLSSQPCFHSIPYSYLLAATVSKLSKPTDLMSAVLCKQVHFPTVLSTEARLGKHCSCFFLSCSCSKCTPFKNFDRLWWVYFLNTVLCQKRVRCSIIVYFTVNPVKQRSCH